MYTYICIHIFFKSVFRYPQAILPNCHGEVSIKLNETTLATQVLDMSAHIRGTGLYSLGGFQFAERAEAARIMHNRMVQSMDKSKSPEFGKAWLN